MFVQGDIGHVVSQNFNANVPVVQGSHSWRIDELVGVRNVIRHHPDDLWLFIVIVTSLFIFLELLEVALFHAWLDHVELNVVWMLILAVEARIDFSCELFADVYDVRIIPIFALLYLILTFR